MSKLLNGATQLQLMIGFILEGLIMVHSFSISYTNVGDDVTVTCPSDKVFSWRFLKTDEILAFCNGKIKINMNTNISERLNISSNCSLQIFQFKKEDVGEYQCSHPNVSVNGKTRHITNVQLRKIKIEGVDYSKVIQAPEGKTVTLICIFKGGKQSETLHWTSGDELLKSGRPPTLKYAFLSKSTDNKKYYTCGSNNSDDKPLQSRIQLFLLHKPNVLIRIHIKSVQVTQQKSIKVKERDKLELLCQLSNESAGSLTWSHNILMLSNSMNNKLIFENVERKITGTFVCTAVNVAGKDSDSVNVLVEYDPLVLDTNEVFSTRYKPRNLKCEVSGEPNIFKFNKWRHVVNGHPVRFLDGNNDGTLTLPFDNTSDIQYDDSGLYICNVSNGIQNKNGQLWQTGTVNVTIKNKPVLAKPHKKVYIGHNSSTTTVAVYLLSSSALSSANWFKEGNNFVQTTPCIASTVNTNFHGTLVDVSGYVCSLSITETEKRNFQNYSVTVSNNCCSNTFNFSIKSAREPGKPNVLRFTSSTNSINVLLEPGSDDGRHQEFIIEYRKQQRKKWKRLLVKNVGTSELICYIPSLNPSTEYEFRIFARNSIGNSSSTDTYKVWTKDEKKYKGYTIAIIIVTTVVTVCLIIICWRHRKSNSFRCEKNVSHRSQATENVDQGGAIENSLYQSANDLTEPSTASGNVETINRSIDKREQNVNRQIVGYNIVGKDDSMRPLDCVELKYREEKNFRYDSSTLNYIEVVFDPAEHKSKFHIHGAENRTPYADIDFSLTADPLTSSDEESLSSHEENNDFVSLEDVQQWNIHDS